MDNISSVIRLLTAMITPAVLILACGSLILTTSQRLARVVERTRAIFDLFEKVTCKKEDEFVIEEKRILFDQLGRATRRSTLLQNCLNLLYLALSCFVATSITIGLVELSDFNWTWIPLVFTMGGAAVLFYCSIQLVVESRMAVKSIEMEMNFLLKIRRHHAPEGYFNQPEISFLKRFFGRD
ncbi:MAG: DUF2721 domain-containing protein [Cytophagaceae bacterium]